MPEIIQWVGYLLGGLAFFAVVGALYGSIAAARDKRRYPPPGLLVDIGGSKLHINCMGTGGPTVVMESGSGNFSLDWCLVQPEIAKHTRVCTYDRAGHGWSGAGKKPRTVVQTVEENRRVGEISFHRLDLDSMTAGLNIKVASTERGKGYAKEAMLLFLDDFFNHMGGRVMTDDVALDNDGAQQALLRFGFEHDQGVKDVFRLRMTRERFNNLYGFADSPILHEKTD